MIVDVFLVAKRSGATHAHAPALTGCNWRGDTPAEAWARAPQAIAEHLAWLRRHGQPAPPPEEPVLPRQVDVRSTALGGGQPGFFDADREPVAAGEVAGFLALMACSRADLLAVTQCLPEEILVRQPAPRSWSIREILRHVANAERWYLTRILPPEAVPQFRPERSIWRRLETVRALAVERLGSLTEAERTALVTDADGELWTARKVFRRFVEHEREHYDHVQQVLAALGVGRET